MKYYKISEDELREFLYDSLKLAALENGGVDNWEWYGTSINDFLKDNTASNESTLYDIANRMINENYYGVEYN